MDGVYHTKLFYLSRCPVYVVPVGVKSGTITDAPRCSLMLWWSPPTEPGWCVILSHDSAVIKVLGSPSTCQGLVRVSRRGLASLSLTAITRVLDRSQVTKVKMGLRRIVILQPKDAIDQCGLGPQHLISLKEGICDRRPHQFVVA